VDIYLDEMPENPEIASDANASSEPMASAYVTATSISVDHITSKLYDSRATQHMTPYKAAMVNYITITPKPINAPNQHTCCTIGWGNVMIVVEQCTALLDLELREVWMSASARVLHLTTSYSCPSISSVFQKFRSNPELEHSPERWEHRGQVGS